MASAAMELGPAEMRGSEGCRRGSGGCELEEASCSTIVNGISEAELPLLLTEPSPPFRIVHVNRAWCRLCAFTWEEAIGQTCRLIQGKQTSAREIAKLHGAIDRREAVVLALTNYTKKRVPFTHSLHVHPIFSDAEGERLSHFVGVMIPEETELTEDLQLPLPPPPAAWHHPMDVDDARLLALFARQRVLLKTVKNDDWITLANGLATRKAWRTSFSLPPPGGAGMCLFGRVSSGCAGIIYQRDAVECSDAFLWPSGYYAKTEHNMITDSKGNVVLLGGRQEKLVSMEELMHANQEHADAMAAADSPADMPVPLSYNELSLMLREPKGLAGVFTRSCKTHHLLFALGVRSLLEHCMPMLGRLPLLLLTPRGGAVPILKQQQVDLLRAVALSTVHYSVDSMEPRLPIDTRVFSELSAHEQLMLHARHGITKKALDSVFNSLIGEGEAAMSELGREASHALAAAIAQNNPASARELVRSAAPFMLRAEGARQWLPQVSPREEHALVVIDGAPPPRRYVELGEAHAASEHEAEGPSTAGTIAKPVIASQDILVALGAQITLREFVAGRTTPRLHSACAQLENWLTQAQRPSCGALIFRLQSWAETKKVEPESDLFSFLCGKAVNNRARFHSALQRLRDAQNGQQYLSVLYGLVRKLHRPCLRLRVLQQVLGLDNRFSRNIVYGVVCLALDVVEKMGGESKLSQSVTVASDQGAAADKAASCINLHEYDEAMQLEANIALGSDEMEESSDPLGDPYRRYRVLCSARH